MNNYNFKVIARIREDLNPQVKQYINDYCKDGII